MKKSLTGKKKLYLLIQTPVFNNFGLAVWRRTAKSGV